jgi:hypothetical protein
MTLGRPATCLQALLDKYNINPSQIAMQYTKASESIQLDVGGLPLIGSVGLTLSRDQCTSDQNEAPAQEGLDWDDLVPNADEL